MRSRYSAYAKGLTDYVSYSWHPWTRPDDLELDGTRRWTGLVVSATADGGPDDATGQVEFSAHFEVNGTTGVQHEVSEFARLAGRWVYVGEAVTE